MKRDVVVQSHLHRKVELSLESLVPSCSTLGRGAEGTGAPVTLNRALYLIVLTAR
jgi:hypothetical protein